MKVFLPVVLLLVFVSCGVMCKTCDLEEYLGDLKVDLFSLECTASKINQSIAILSKSNSAIEGLRTAQYKKIKKAINDLQSEIKAISDSLNKDSDFVQGPMNMGYIFANGTIGSSCLHYKQAANGRTVKDGLYAIQPGSQVLTVFCDMTNNGGGWTMIAAFSSSYSGPLFQVFDDSVVAPSSPNTSFHLPTTDLLAISNQIMAVSDMDDSIVTNFFTSNWTYGAYCEINSRLRELTASPSASGENVEAPCYQSSGSRTLPVTPTHYTYGRTSNNHSIGFRMGVPLSSSLGGYAGHMDFHGWVTLSFPEDTSGNGAFYGIQGFGPDTGFGFNLGGNGALFLR